MLTAEQKEKRLNYCGGSDIPKILFGKAYTTFYQKLGMDDRTTMCEAAYAGSILEDTVAKRFFEPYTGLKVRKLNKHLTHPKYDWLAANVDSRIEHQKAGYEGKCRTAYKRKEWGRVECNPRQFTFEGKILHYEIPDMDEAEGYLVPRDEYYQCQHYMLWEDIFKYYYICTLVDGNTLLTRRILPNKEVQEEIIEKTHDFWYNNVKKNISPMPTEQDFSMVKSNYSGCLGSFSDFSEDEKLQSWLKLYDELNAEMKSAKAKKEELQAWIIEEKIKNLKGIRCLGRTLTFNRTKKTLYMGTTGKGYKHD